MKVLHLLPELRYGGSESVAILLCLYQVEVLGYDSKIVIFGSNSRPNLVKGISVIQLEEFNTSFSWSRLTKTQYENTFQYFLEKENPDIIHSHAEWTHMIALSCKSSRYKYIFHFHRFLQWPSNKGSFLRKLSESLLLSLMLFKYNNSEIVVVSKALKRDLLKKLPFVIFYSCGKVQIIGNPIKKVSQYYRKEANTGIYKFLTVSRLEEEKNILQVITIAKALKMRGFSFKWTIVGDGKLYNQIVEMCNEEMLGQELILSLPSEKLECMYRDFDLYISVSKRETFGLSILEALAHCVPVVAQKNYGSSEFLRDNENCIYKDFKSENEIAESIISFLQLDNNFKSRFINKGLNVAKEYELPIISSKFVNLYNN
jgi:glycosyltransferase involved in cell wall biosynthesis